MKRNLKKRATSAENFTSMDAILEYANQLVENAFTLSEVVDTIDGGWSGNENLGRFIETAQLFLSFAEALEAACDESFSIEMDIDVSIETFDIKVQCGVYLPLEENFRMFAEGVSEGVKEYMQDFTEYFEEEDQEYSFSGKVQF